jgi:hypothetical protein
MSQLPATLPDRDASLLWPGVISRPAKILFHLDFGDLPTWLLAVFALFALVAAVCAYFDLSKAGRDLAKQVKTHGEALADQRQATAALAAQANTQRRAFEMQQEANSLQARVVELELRAVVRQQAEQIRFELET